VIKELLRLVDNPAPYLLWSGLLKTISMRVTKMLIYHKLVAARSHGDPSAGNTTWSPSSPFPVSPPQFLGR